MLLGCLRRTTSSRGNAITIHRNGDLVGTTPQVFRNRQQIGRRFMRRGCCPSASPLLSWRFRPAAPATTCPDAPRRLSCQAPGRPCSCRRRRRCLPRSRPSESWRRESRRRRYRRAASSPVVPWARGWPLRMLHAKHSAQNMRTGDRRCHPAQ